MLGGRTPCLLTFLSHQMQVLLVLLARTVFRIPRCSCLATISPMPLVQAQEGEEDMRYGCLSGLIYVQAHQHHAFPFPDDSG